MQKTGLTISNYINFDYKPCGCCLCMTEIYDNIIQVSHVKNLLR